MLGPVGEGEEIGWPHTMAKLQTHCPLLGQSQAGKNGLGELSASQSHFGSSKFPRIRAASLPGLHPEA